jgi:phage shock protein B
MTSVLVVALVFGSILTFAALICGTILALAKMRQSGLSKGTKNSRTDEAKIIQEIYQGLSKMEERIEALETILMDSKEKKENRNE